jgi:hypothetical protein
MRKLAWLLLALVSCDASKSSEEDAGTRGNAGSCVADFPCGTRAHLCTGATTYRQAVTQDCHVRCGPGPCSGMSCEPTGPEMSCPAGMVCKNPWLSSGTFQPACGVPEPDAAVVDAYSGAIESVQEGQACSYLTSDNPRRVCSAPLACVATHRMVERDGPDSGTERVFLCRQLCKVPTDCPGAGDLCCYASSDDPAYWDKGPLKACVPAALCQFRGDDAGP